MGHIFERELKGILSADENMLARVTKTCTPEEKTGYAKVRESPFLVIRAAGSLGMDIVAIRWAMAFPIEVKSSAKDVLRFSRSEKLLIQAEQMKEDCMRVELVPLYAFRLKGRRGDAWRIFALDIGESDGKFHGLQKRVYEQLPKVEPSKEGNFIMRWNEGCKLSKFIEYVAFLNSQATNTRTMRESGVL
jgi:Holliday junction resolvase